MKHHYLTQQDTIKEGDEEKTNWGTWEPVKSEWVGKRKGAIVGWYCKIRRQPREAGDDCSKDA